MSHSRPIRARRSLKLASTTTTVVLLAACGNGSDALDKAAGDASNETPATPLEAAKDTCAPTSPYATIGDEGKSLVLDHKGEEETAGLSIEDVACVLAELNVSDSVSSQIDSTRALDGRQTGGWDQFSASWIYHPDDGIDLIITMDES